MKVLSSLTVIAILLTLSFDVAGQRNRDYGKYRSRPYNRPGVTKPTTPGSGTEGAVGSAKDDPNFNECKNIPQYRRMKVTLKPEAKLTELIGWISSLTCRKFILTKNIRAQEVTIYSPTAVTPNEAYRAFLSALEAMGLMVVKSGAYWKITESDKAKNMVHPVIGPGGNAGTGEVLVTAMLRVKYADLQDVSDTLGKFKSKYGEITVYKPTNLIIITDLADSINRLKRILNYLDVEGVNNEKIWVVNVKYGDADEIANKLKEVFDTQGGSTKPTTPTATSNYRRNTRRKVYTPATATQSKPSTVGTKSSLSKIISDQRTNSLIIKADDTSYLEVLSLIRKLDVQLPGGEEKIHIVYLENADAEEMAGLLATLTGSGTGTRPSTSRRTTSSRSTSSRSSTSSYRSPYGGGYGSYGRGNSQQTQSIFKGPVQMQADRSTNALVIMASSKDFLQLRRIIKELDKPRRQVFVEVTIMEVSLTKTQNLGMSFHGGNTVGTGDQQSILFGGSISNQATNSIIMNPLSLMGFAVGLRGPEIAEAESLLGLPGITFPSFGVFFQALQTNNAVNVISTPHLLTTNNEEAEISVGENVPFQAGVSGISGLASSLGASASGLLSTGVAPIQRQDVVLKLKIVPHVNQSNFVRMEVDQEINEVKSIDQIVGPTTSKRKASTVVVVKDQQTVVIGGLMTEKLKTTATKVPLLGDIPLFGYLFKSTVKNVEKTNLLIFITPYIIRDESDLRRIFQEKIKQRKEFIEKFAAFKDHDIDQTINYKHKCGMFEEINREARRMENEAELKRKAMEEYKEINTGGPVVVRTSDSQNLAKTLKTIRDEDEKAEKEDEKKIIKQDQKNKDKKIVKPADTKKTNKKKGKTR